MVILKEYFEEDNKKSRYKIPRTRKNDDGCQWEITGFYRVYVCFKAEKVEYWKYINEEKCEKLISTNLLELRDEVIKRHWPWKMNDYYHACRTAKLVGLPLLDLKEKVNYKKFF
ncbi:MAG: hypothetical protein IJ258_11325 [Methanobrevibacter sp.]|uniref:hypothetical protein n=1 Tax=Methanobrevibacter sp. TaxID=66852 RepID=UPI0025D321AE|nr:hypothetical protein [Methanobrevibacter sp.]MBQ8018668.1 hypothetical protein [Methanobrevibacter sp.]